MKNIRGYMSEKKIDRKAYLIEFNQKYLKVNRYTVIKEDIRLIRDNQGYPWDKVKNF